MIAFHYPPYAGSSGLQRTLKFTRYLLDHDWQPVVLGADPKSFVARSDEQLDEIPAQVEVVRSWALDTARHLSVAGWHPASLALPDRWMTWRWSAVSAGMRMIRRLRPAAIWSTYPIATAHLIAERLARRSGLPWVADFRDMMFEGDYPVDPRRRAAYRRIESAAVHAASRVVVTTPGTQRLYADRYRNLPSDRWQCIPNGYDEDDFVAAAQLPRARRSGVVRLVHSGALYPSERDPRAFFAALAGLRRRGDITPDNFCVTLRATGHDELYQGLIGQYGIRDLVVLAPGIGHREALAEMLNADGLLLFQASSCNNQVPAKLYEYFRAGRPILALTDPVGDTARTMQDAGVGDIAMLDDSGDIEKGLIRFIDAIRKDAFEPLSAEELAGYSRRGGAADLARTLEAVCAAPRGGGQDAKPDRAHGLAGGRVG